MKKTGWAFLILGVVSFLGAVSTGKSVLGPLFWGALGAYLIHRANQKATEQNNKAKIANYNADESNKKQESPTPDNKPVIASVQSTEPQLESIEDIQTQLTLQQREAAMCLIAFFAGYDDNLMDDAPIMLFKQAALFFGLPDSLSALSHIMAKYTDADVLVDIVTTIKPVKAKEFLLLTCYDLIRSAHNSEAHDLLYNIANDMGYDHERLTQLIRQYSR